MLISIRSSCLALLTVLLTSATAVAEPLSPIPGVIGEGTKLQLVADGYKFTEGPASDDSGNVYFTDQPNDQILRFDAATREVTTWMKPAGRSNGMFFAPDGQLIACADGKNELWAINVTNKMTSVIVGQFQGKRFNGPNDCWVDSDGTIYFTDPFYKRPWWDHDQQPLELRDVYRVSPSGDNLKVVASDFQMPNGIVGDAEKRLLFIADIGANQTFRFRIDDDGQLTDRTLFCASGSDGMTIDQQGRLYLTGNKGVTVFDADGKELGVISVPKRWTANVCFGGKNRDELLITAGDSVFAVKTLTQGL